MKNLLTFLIILVCLVFNVSVFAETIWRDDFEKIENWYDNKADSSFKAQILPGKKQGMATVQQKGDGTWGKIAFVLTDVNLDKFNILRVKVDNVDKNGDFKILATSLDWNTSFTLIDRGMGKGTHEVNIQQITSWKGKTSFNIVIIVEGKDKKADLDWIEVVSKE